MSHASQVSQSGMTPGGESIGQGSGDHQSSEFGGDVGSDRDDNHRSAMYRAQLNNNQAASNTVQHTPLKGQEIARATYLGKGTPMATSSVLGKREARHDVGGKHEARKKPRQEPHKPPQNTLLQDLFPLDE